MRRASRIAVLALAVLPAVLIATGTAASAVPRRCGDPGRPPCTILRPPELGPPPDTDHTAPECIVAVGGFGSTNGDGTFDDLLGWTNDATLYQVFQFGHDRADLFEYDSEGPIDVSGEHLRGLLGSLRLDCRAIHVVAHSMGGVVADRALSKVLSERDRVRTYIALSGPHNGATLAKALRRPIERDPLVAIEMSVFARTLGQPDPTTAAARDLALLERPRHRTVPATIAAGRFRVATDGMVLRRDNRDRRVEMREYVTLDAVEGHGAVLHNDQVRRVLHTTIAARELAVDNRSMIERQVADLVGTKLDGWLSALYFGLSGYLRDDPSAPFALAEAYGAVAIGKVVWQAMTEALAAIPDALILLGPPAVDLVLP